MIVDELYSKWYTVVVNVTHIHTLALPFGGGRGTEIGEIVTINISCKHGM